METEKVFEHTLNIRNFEIDLFWRRSNYFLVLNTAIAIALFSDKVKGYDIHISALGFIVCLLWFLVNLGSKFWQDRWEYQLHLVEKELDDFHFKLFTANKSELKDIVKRSLDHNEHKWFRKIFDSLILRRPSVSFMMILLSLISMLFWLIIFIKNTNISFEFIMDTLTVTTPLSTSENYYWLFSASAQSIAAFIAILLTGFAIVLSIMSTMEERDETLTDILHSMKVKYYKIIKYLALITGAAIISSLYSVYINSMPISYKLYIYIAAAVFDLASIVGGILFMLYIINPDRYKNLAKKMYEEEKKKIVEEGKKADGIIFIQSFIQLEKLVRDIIDGKDIYVDRQYYKRERLSFGMMIEILLRNELIDGNQHKKLLEITKIRNLVVHGKINRVDEELIGLTNELIESLRNAYNKQINTDAVM